MNLAQMIRSARRALNLTQEELGKRVGTSLKQVWKWEKGIDIPSPERLLLLSAKLGLSHRELLDAEWESRAGERERIIKNWPGGTPPDFGPSSKLSWIAGRLADKPEDGPDEVRVLRAEAQELMDRASVELQGQPAEAFESISRKYDEIVRRIDRVEAARHHEIVNRLERIERRLPQTPGTGQNTQPAQKDKSGKSRRKPRPET